MLQIQGEKLDAFKKVKTVRKAKEVMIAALDSDLKNRFTEYAANGEMQISVAHTANEAEAKLFAEELQATFRNVPVKFIDPLSLSVSCHIGPGSLACALSRVL